MTCKFSIANFFIVLSFAILATLASLTAAKAGPNTPNATEKSTIELLSEPAQRFHRFMQTAAGGAGKYTSKPKRKKIKCNGKTTSECCSGLSYCGCLYMPGSSDDNHPTSCHSNPPPRPGRG
ncbi:MAG: hypothetical protein ACRBCJ_02280 [Hyphomicrobiaceae bacterium]